MTLLQRCNVKCCSLSRHTLHCSDMSPGYQELAMAVIPVSKRSELLGRRNHVFCNATFEMNDKMFETRYILKRVINDG